jgi:hypothetical protein
LVRSDSSCVEDPDGEDKLLKNSTLHAVGFREVFGSQVEEGSVLEWGAEVVFTRTSMTDFELFEC